jgi:HAD superfamily hydrolase (TIGR01549 family)
MKLLAIIIDFYGTIVQEANDIVSIIIQNIRNKSDIPDVNILDIRMFWQEYYETLYFKSYDSNFIDRKTLEYNSLKAVIEKFKSKYDITDGYNLLLNDYKNPKTYQDAINFLEKISIPIHIITNMDKEIMYDVLNKIKIPYSSLTTHEDVRCYKSSEKILDYAINKTKLNESDLIYIGDSLNNDIRIANIVGIKSCWINRNKGINNTKYKPEKEINNFTELLEYIE